MNTLTNADHDIIWEILQQFDFEKVHNVMTHLGWIWTSTRDVEGNELVGVPSLHELRSSARSQMIQAIEWLRVRAPGTRYRTGTGGFEVSADLDDDGRLWMELKFVLASWDNWG